MTNPKRVASPVKPDVAWSAAAKIAAVFPVLATPAEIFDRVLACGRTLGIGGPSLFDLVIAFTALHHGVSEVYTFDDAVFGKVPGIIVRTPQG